MDRERTGREYENQASQGKSDSILPDAKRPYNRLESLDQSIEFKEQELKALKHELELFKGRIERQERELKELQKVRKVVTPELEAAVKALRQVGLV